MVTLRDIIAAEEAVEAAEEEYRRYNNNPSEWSAFQSLEKNGRRVLNVSEAHFERRAAAMDRIRVAKQQLLATKRAFFEGVLDADR